MDLPTGNFFEVTINSNKLFSYIQQLSDHITQQDIKIEQLSQVGINLQGSICSKINGKLDEINLEMERAKRYTQEELNHFKLLVKDQDRLLEKKISQFAANTALLSKKIEAVQNQFQEDTSLKFSYLQRKIQNNLSAQDFQTLLRQDFQKYNLKLQRMASKQAEDVKKLQDKIRNVAYLNQAPQRPQLYQSSISHIADPLSVTCTFGQRTKVKSQTRKRLRTQRFGALFQQSTQIQNFKEKIELIEQKINNTKENQKVKFGGTLSDIQYKDKQILREIMDKITKVSESYERKIPQFQQKINKLSNRCEVINEHIGIISRKADKYKASFSQFYQNLKRIDEKIVDDRTIQNIKNSIKVITKQFEQAIEAKISQDIFEKQKKNVSQKIDRLFNLIDDKCDKGQVKKGLLFLEDKIKDIIIVMAEDRNFNKDSATRKIQAKCLSCDKQLEPTPQDNTQNIQNIHKSVRTTTTNSLTGRGSTSQLRKRIRVINGSIVGEESYQ